MGLPNEIHPLQLCASSGAYEINQSLRFDGSAYLNRTPASAGNRRTWTLSFWFKRGKLGTSQVLYSASDNYGSPSSANYFYIAVSDADDKMYVQQIYPTYNAALDFSPNGRVFRDPSAWYHVVLAIDTTQATGSNRQKMWINGELQTLVNGTSGGPTTISQNYDTTVNTTNEHRLGRYTSAYWDGYLAEVNFIDGTALTPSSFGETDTITGAWIPKKYSGSYGTNGFYLKYESSGIGTDSSGNGNNWTANNFSTSGTGTDVMSDTPTNNYVTWNPLTGYGTYSEGNLRGVTTTNDPRSVVSSMSVNEGKWYCEVTCTSITVDCAIGITPSTFPRDVNSRNYSFGDNVTYYSGTGNKHVDGSSSAYGSSYTTNDVIGIALDIDSNQLTFYKNGVSQGTISKTFSGFYNISCTSGASADSQTVTLNGGQRSFEYTQPSGFKAWNTANLPEPTIKKGGAHFNTVLYTGTGSTQSISGVGFQPDFVWIKKRSATENHELQDAVRGATKRLASNVTDAEVTVAGSISSFNTDGFTVVDAGTTNELNYTYVAWNWKANGAGSSNTAGSITSTVSANATAGFSIVTYTSPNNAADQTVGHGLGVKPSLIIVKNRDLTYNWDIYHASLGYNASLIFTTAGTRSGAFGAEPTSTVFTTKTGYTHNSTNTYVAYCFSEVASFSKFGSYTGNGSSDGPFVFCGFRPAWILLKSTSSGSWELYDTARDTYNQSEKTLEPNSSAAEGSGYPIDVLSNGFKVRTSNSQINFSSYSYIFAAFSETAFKFANAR